MAPAGSPHLLSSPSSVSSLPSSPCLLWEDEPPEPISPLLQDLLTLSWPESREKAAANLVTMALTALAEICRPSLGHPISPSQSHYSSASSLRPIMDTMSKLYPLQLGPGTLYSYICRHAP